MAGRVAGRGRAIPICVEVSQKIIIIDGVYNVVFDYIIIDCNAEL